MQLGRGVRGVWSLGSRTRRWRLELETESAPAIRIPVGCSTSVIAPESAEVWQGPSPETDMVDAVRNVMRILGLGTGTVLQTR